MYDRQALLDYIRQNIDIDIVNDKGDIKISIPDRILGRVNEFVSANVEKEEISEEMKKKTAPNVINGFGSTITFTQIDPVGECDNYCILIPKVRFLHIWFDRQSSEDEEKYNIIGSMSELYYELFDGNKTDVHTYIWDTDIITFNEGTQWADIFIHYYTYKNNELVLTCESFNNWNETSTTAIIKSMVGERLTESVKTDQILKFISETADENFKKLRERGSHIPAGTIKHKTVEPIVPPEYRVN